VVPIVNTFGFINQSRYLPDRRDLNRSFPGSPERLAGRAAGASVHDRDRRAPIGHRSAFGRDPAHQLPQVRVSAGDQTCAARWPRSSARRSSCTSPLRDRVAAGRGAERGRDGPASTRRAKGCASTRWRARRVGGHPARHASQGHDLVPRRAPAKAPPQRLPVQQAGNARRWAGCSALPNRWRPCRRRTMCWASVTDPFGEVEREIARCQAGDHHRPRQHARGQRGRRAVPHRPHPGAVDGEAWVEAVTEHLDDEQMFDEDEII
jgi:hypothetical protein